MRGKKMGFFCFDSFQRRGRVGCKGEKTFLPRWFPGQWGAGMKTVLYLDELLLVNFVEKVKDKLQNIKKNF